MKDSESHGKKDLADQLLLPQKPKPKQRQRLRLLLKKIEIEHRLLPLGRKRQIDRRMALAPS